MLTVGRFRSSPWAPYYAARHAWTNVEWVDCVSSEVRLLAETGRLDVTPMATVDWLELQTRFVRIGSHGLAYRERASSVLLFSNTPIEELGSTPIAISTETTTSVRVLRAIMAGRYGLSLGPLIAMHDAVPASMPRLLIQDQALEENAKGRFRHVYDLGREWWAWQRTPVVSAVWVARFDLPAGQLQRATAMLDTALQWSAEHRDVMAERHLRPDRSRPSTLLPASPRAPGSRRLPLNPASLLSPKTLAALVDNFTYQLGPEEERGIDTMRRLLGSRQSIDNAYEASPHAMPRLELQSVC